jgi:hypothetical protein
MTDRQQIGTSVPIKVNGVNADTAPGWQHARCDRVPRSVAVADPITIRDVFGTIAAVEIFPAVTVEVGETKKAAIRPAGNK